jgi:hypothetical protein
VAEAAVAEAAGALEGDATATSGFDLRSSAGNPDPLEGLGRSGQAETDRTAT